MKIQSFAEDLVGKAWRVLLLTKRLLQLRLATVWGNGGAECIEGDWMSGEWFLFLGLLQTGEDPNAAKYGAAIPAVEIM